MKAEEFYLLWKVVLMDLHLENENNVKSSDMKSLLNGSALLAFSLWNDNETKALADRYGAVELLDKANLAFDLIPAIKRSAKQ